MQGNNVTNFPAGWHRDLSNHDYHSSSGASSSFLKRFLDATPFEIEYSRQYVQRKSNPVYDLGTAVHTLTLEPHKVESSIAIQPAFNLRTLMGRADADAFQLANAEKTIVTEKLFDTARAMSHELLTHPIAASLLEGSINEQSIFWYHDKHLLKVRPDALCRKKPLLLDIKTCDNASFDQMKLAVTKYRYHMSAAMYLAGVNQCGDLLHALGIDEFLGFVLLCVESDPPHQVACYELGDDLLSDGRLLLDEAFDRYTRALETGWHTYPPVLRVLDAPRWRPAAAIL